MAEKRKAGRELLGSFPVLKARARKERQQSEENRRRKTKKERRRVRFCKI